MNGTQIKWKIKYLSQYFPFTLNLFLYIVAAWIVRRLLNQHAPDGENVSTFTPFIIIMMKISVMFLFVLIGLSALSTFYCFIYYLYIKSVKNRYLNIAISKENKDDKLPRQYIVANIEGVFRPFLGFVKVRLYYDNNIMTPAFALLSNKRNEQQFWRSGISGKMKFSLPDIKEYEIRGGFIYFQDMLHLFSLCVAQPIAGHFYQPPKLLEESEADVMPKKTESMDVRIEQLRKVEGEYLNYKDFESGDDVRRIVWKIYAKNRDLVVRMPELYEPYSSHLYFYASFFTSNQTKWISGDFLKEMLNFYKNSVWTIYDTLAHKEWAMRFIPDQSFTIPGEMTEDERNARIISNCIWQKDNSLSDYFNVKNGALLCISSLADVEDIKNLLEKCDASTVIYFVKLSRAFSHSVPLSLLKRIVFLSPPDRLSKLKTRYTFSTARIHINKHEKLIEDVLNKSQVTWGEL